MQKKLIALAVAGLVSAPAFAQSNVTVYGVVDMGLNYSSSSEAVNPAAKLKSRSAIDSGLQSGSRLGFRGTEDLGNGLKVGFVLEMGLNADLGTSGQGGRTFGRQTILTLSGDFGTVALGRMYTPQFGLVTRVDPFGTGTVGDVSYGRGVYTMATGRLIGTAVAGADGEIRLDNVAAYVSPSFSGFNVTAAYTRNGLGDENRTLRGNQSADTRVWAVSPVYSNGPLLVGLNYHRVKNDNLDAKSRVYDLGFSYDFGVVKLAALYGQNRDDVGALDHKDKKWMIGATIPVSEVGSVMVSYSRLKSDSDVAALDDDRASKWAVGYTHSLSKRTNLYAAYAHLSTNRDAKGEFSVGGTGAVVNGNFTSGLNVGLRHSF